MHNVCFLILALLAGPAGLLRAQSIWTPVAEIDRVTVSALLEHEGMLFAATPSTVYRSLDGGDRWYPAASFPSAEPTPDIASLAAAGSRLFAATLTDGVFESTDRGESWTAYSSGLTGLARGVFALTVRGDTLLASTNGAGIYARDVRGGAPWRPYNEGLSWSNGGPVATFRDMFCAVVSDFCYVRRRGEPAWSWLPWTPEGFQSTTYVLHAHGDHLFAGNARGISRWNGTDSVWTRLDLSPAPNRHVTSMASDGKDLHATIFLTPARHLHVVSSDAGESWSVVDTVQGEVQALLAAGRKIWSARTDGLWSRSLEPPLTSDGPPAPQALRLRAPYPQPAHGHATVVVELDREARVTLRLLDLLGRVVRTIADADSRGPGRHAMVIPLDAVPPGTYLLHLRTANAVAVRKVLVR